MTHDSPAIAQVDEPLTESAPLAWHLAPKACRKDPVTGRDCAWNHGLWQYLRLMGLGGSPEINADFYWRAFQTVTSNVSSPRILISGAADYSMLAHVLAAFRARDIDPAVTVVDLCETPLWLNRWYAERMSCKIKTQSEDISEFEAPAAFDTICTHSFFGQIPRDRRPKLIAAWRRLLRPGGLAITVDRIRSVNSDAPIGFTVQQAREFCATVRRKAGEMRESPGIDPHELARAAETYAANQALYPVRSREEIRELFERAGFTIDQLICGPNEVRTEQGDSGPAIPAKAEYARVIATRL